jgi:hypothetical protein
MSDPSGWWEFPDHPGHGEPGFRCSINGVPSYVNLGDFPEHAGHETFLDRLRKLETRGRKFFARIRSHVGGVTYKILEHRGDPLKMTFTGPLLQAYWLRSSSDDPDLDVGTVVVAGRDAKGRVCFQVESAVFIGADAINRIDEANAETVYADTDNCSNDGTGGAEERLLIHFPHETPVLWNDDYGYVNLGVEGYQSLLYTIAWGGGPNYSTDLDIAFGTKMRLVLNDFEPTTVTWKSAITDGGLTLGSVDATFSDIHNFDPSAIWDPGGPGATTDFTLPKNPLGGQGTEINSFASDPTDTSCYGVELRFVAASVDSYSGGSAAPTITSYTHLIIAQHITTIAWRKLWFVP